MLTEKRKAFLETFARHYSKDCVNISEDFSSAMIFAKSNNLLLDTFIHFAEDSNHKPTISLEFAIAIGNDLPVNEISYSMHVINYAAMRKQGIPNFILSLRPGIKSPDGSSRLPMAVVMVVSTHVANLRESDLITLFESSIQQAFGVKTAMLQLIESVDSTDSEQ